MKKSNLIIAFLLIAVAVAALVTTDDVTGGQAVFNEIASDSLLTVKHPAGIEPEILRYTGFNVAFSAIHHQPFYVAWELTPEEATSTNVTRREARFVSDPEVNGCATLDDYRNSGFDRGHMAPAADMKWSADAMAQCHYLTNICPQDKSVNAGPWATVEKNARQWAVKYGNLYIIAGPVLTDQLTRSIGKSKVPVPERFFKVIIAPEADPPMGIAFLMPNHRFTGGAQATVTSIDDIEDITGFDFFSYLPDEIETAVEQQHSMARWNH